MSTIIVIAFGTRRRYDARMLTSDVIRHFGSQAATARALGIAQPAVFNWGEHPPPLRQLQIQALTGGKLKAAPGILPRKRREAA